MILTETSLIDSNVLLYLFEKDSLKKATAEETLQRSTFVHPQVLCEVANVLKRRLGFEKVAVVNAVEDILGFCACLPFSEETFRSAFKLIERYDFHRGAGQFFDSIIVAAALEARCSVLYSEDMQHDLLVNEQLRIINPFVENTGAP